MTESLETATVTTPDARDAVLTLLRSRAPDATICPSEAARALADGSGSAKAAWRDLMPAVHAAVDRLVMNGTVTLTWKGRPLSRRAGPYRIARAARP